MIEFYMKLVKQCNYFYTRFVFIYTYVQKCM